MDIEIIIILILVCIIIYYIFNKNNKNNNEQFILEKMDSNSINNINNFFKTDLTNMRFLGNILTNINNKKPVILENDIKTIINHDLILNGDVDINYDSDKLYDIFPRYMIIMWNDTIDKIPKGWALCDGSSYNEDFEKLTNPTSITTPIIQNDFILSDEVSGLFINNQDKHYAYFKYYNITIPECEYLVKRYNAYGYSYNSNIQHFYIYFPTWFKDEEQNIKGQFININLISNMEQLGKTDNNSLWKSKYRIFPKSNTTTVASANDAATNNNIIIKTPDLREKFIIGVGKYTEKDEDISYKLNDIGGEKNVTLNIENIPKHKHDLLNNMNIFLDENKTTKIYYRYNTDVMNDADKSYNSVIYKIEHKTLFNDKKKTEQHNNLPPYYSLYYIMKL